MAIASTFWLHRITSEPSEPRKHFISDLELVQAHVVLVSVHRIRVSLFDYYAMQPEIPPSERRASVVATPSVAVAPVPVAVPAAASANDGQNTVTGNGSTESINVNEQNEQLNRSGSPSNNNGQSKKPASDQPDTFTALATWIRANPGKSVLAASLTIYIIYKLAQLSTDRDRLLEMLEREKERVKLVEEERNRALVVARREAAIAAAAQKEAAEKDDQTGLWVSAILGGVILLGRALMG